MKRVLVRYKLKAGRAAENEQLIRRVFAELETTRPSGLRYGVFKLKDGVSFVHIAEQEIPGEEHSLKSLRAFRDFLEGIPERCEEMPSSSELENVGSFRFFGQ